MSQQLRLKILKIPSLIELLKKVGLGRNKQQKVTNKRVAIIGSGPAGLTAADQLNQAGHSVIVLSVRTGLEDY